MNKIDKGVMIVIGIVAAMILIINANGINKPLTTDETNEIETQLQYQHQQLIDKCIADEEYKVVINTGHYPSELVHNTIVIRCSN